MVGNSKILENASQYKDLIKAIQTVNPTANGLKLIKKFSKKELEIVNKIKL